MRLKGKDRYGHREEVVLIDGHEARGYIVSLLSIRKRMLSAFEGSDDLSFRKWVNTHGPVLDELLEDLGYQGKLYD